MNKMLLPVLVGLLVLSIGLTTQNAYAGFEEEEPEDLTIWCYTDGSIERPGEFWTEGICEIFVESEEIDFEFEVEIHGDLDLDGEGRCRDASTELTIFIDDYGYEGTIVLESEGESCRNPPVVNTEQEFVITEGTGDFSFITGGSGTLFTEMDRSRNFEVEIHGSLEVESRQAVELHCETEFYWEVAYGYGHREGYGECIVIYDNGDEEEIEVYVHGEFSIDLDFPDAIIEGGFHIDVGEYEEEAEHAIWIEEEGIITGLPYYDIETTGYVDETMGTIFDGLEGCAVETFGEGSLTDFDYPYFEGEGERTLWIVCEIEEEPEVEDNNGGGSCNNCTPPTLGLNKQGDFSPEKRLVVGGFTCNGQTVDVMHYFTEFPTVTNAVGEPLRCTFKIYEDTGADNIRHFEFAVGKKVGDAMSEEQGKITWDRDHLLVSTTTYDENLFRNVSIFPSTNLVNCTPDASAPRCLQLNLSATPKEPLVEDIIVKTNVWDQRRNAKTNFYNDGIDFVGNTENTLPYFTVLDGRHGSVNIYTTDFTLEDQTHAIDQYGQTWTLKGNFWQKDYVAPDRSCDVSTYIGYDRTCPEYTILKQGQILLAEQYFNSADIQSELDDSFAYEFPERTDRLSGTQLRD